MRVAQNLILLPVAIQVLLTLAVLIILAVRRARYLSTENKEPQDMAVATATDWDVPSQQAANNLRNQFEVPVLFYVACLFALTLRYVDVPVLMLALVFAVSRIVHTAVHVTANYVLVRGTAWLVGLGSVTAIWVILVWRVLEAEL